MTEQVHRCLHCKQKIEVIPGHRKKQYCNDLCRQAAHRQRVEKARLEQEERDRQARIQRERAALIEAYGDLLCETLDLLQSLQSPSLIQRIARVIAAERQRARDDYGRERNVLTEELLLMGEQIGFAAISTDLFQLEADIAAWLAFCDDASLEWLYLAKDAAYLKLRAADGRKRLLQLAPQT
jgi:hypothetical protein